MASDYDDTLEPSTTQDDIDRFRRLLDDATKSIASDYFLQQVAPGEGEAPPIRYRERVYAHELYHQLRRRWPQGWEYSLGGEIDKQWHPIFRDVSDLKDSKPDLLAHEPGRMSHNLAAVEIKAPSDHFHNERLERDLKKLLAFRRRPANYAPAFLIVFGEDARAVEGIQRYARQHFNADDLAFVKLLHRSRVGEQAESLDW
jgi:hypothetical protein